jgi:hypothetical protein
MAGACGNQSWRTTLQPEHMTPETRGAFATFGDVDVGRGGNLGFSNRQGLGRVRATLGEAVLIGGRRWSYRRARQRQPVTLS